MKNIIAFLLIAILPINLFAKPDRCSTKREDLYKADKRCYVTNEDKKKSPYNAVVGLIKDNWIRCSGTIVKNNDTLYLYTAKHCADDDEDNITDKIINIQTQTGSMYSSVKKHVGTYTLESGDNLEGDWAVYEIKAKNLPSVTTSKALNFGNKELATSYDARLIGYSKLKIMSDEDIKNFKNKYINYLKNKHKISAKGTEEAYGFDATGGILARDDKEYGNSYVIKFLNYLFEEEPSYYSSIFEDTGLKVSECQYFSSGAKKGCQSWVGNSGAGIFDNSGNLMAINTRSNKYIGGTNHAGKDFEFFESGQINLLETTDERVKNLFDRKNKLDTLPKGR